MTFPVELTFEVLPPIVVEDVELPAQIDITKVLLTIVGPGGKPRQVDILKTFSEDQIMLWEDQIIDSLYEDADEE
ncbi:hypothetical protein [Limnohabitans sp.]|uniref:hypothetical protein n=1 Tax=Limnohabitans sp. TaxID=1907725 RepID=UPI003341A5F7